MSDTHETEPTVTPAGEKEKTALAFASMLALAVLQALRESGAKQDPERLAEIEQQLESGEATLAVYIQRDRAKLYLSACPVPKGIQDPFGTGNALRIIGPMILSREQLAALGEAVRAPRREAMN